MAVEKYVGESDASEMKVLNEDVDTLLIFVCKCLSAPSAMSAGISAIPTLLELAVVLFFTGLVVLVWTLDRVVAVVITTAVSFVILILVTVLPAVYCRCPYKLPTGWACVIIFNALTLSVRCTLLRLGKGIRIF